MRGAGRAHVEGVELPLRGPRQRLLLLSRRRLLRAARRHLRDGQMRPLPARRIALALLFPFSSWGFRGDRCGGSARVLLWRLALARGCLYFVQDRRPLCRRGLHPLRALATTCPGKRANQQMLSSSGRLAGSNCYSARRADLLTIWGWVERASCCVVPLNKFRLSQLFVRDLGAVGFGTLAELAPAGLPFSGATTVSTFFLSESFALSCHSVFKDINSPCSDSL